MSKTVEQIYAINPTTVVADTDLYYLVQSPYTPGTDAAISGASLKAAFGAGGTISPGLANQLAYYASSGSTISGLTTAANGVLITSGAGVPSISSTLPTAVQNNITRVGTVVSGIWNGSVIIGTFGGTGVNNGSSTITIGGSFSMIGAFTFAGTLTGNTAVTFPTSGTLATTAQLLASPLTTKGDLWGWSTTNDRLPVGTINGQILQVNSGAALGLSYSTTTYPSTALNVARILRSDGTNYVDSTSTFADTYTASSVLYANGANNVAGLTTANNGLLVTSNTGVPSILAGPGTTGNMLISNAAAAPSFTTFTYPTTVGASGSIHISNGTNIVSSTSLWPNTVGTAGKIVQSDGTNNVYSTPTWPTVATSTGSFVYANGTNFVASTSLWPNTVGSAGKIIRSDGTTNAYSTATFADTYTASNLLYSNGANTVTGLATANSSILVTNSSGVPSLSTTIPSHTTDSITFSPTTHGLVGTTTNDNAAATYVGEYLSSVIPTASAVSLTTGTPKTITSITLTAGDWDVRAGVFLKPAAGTTTSAIGVAISLTDNAFGATLSDSQPANLIANIVAPAGQANYLDAGVARQSVSGNTTVYVVVYSTFAVSTMAAYGYISARRVR